MYGDVLHGEVQLPADIIQLHDARAYMIRRINGGPLSWGSFALPSLPITVLTITLSLLLLEVLME